MNIGIFTDTYYPEVNGVANSTYQLKRGLEELGHKVYVFTVTNPNANIESETNVFRIASVPFILCKERRVGCPIIRKWKRVIKELELDIIHTQTEFIMGHLGHKVAEYLDIPHVHTYHTIYEDYTHYLRIPGNKRLKGVVRSFSRHCCNNADVVIVPTDKVKKILAEYHVDKEIKVIPTGINLNKFMKFNKLNTNKIKKDLGLLDKHVLIYIGRISEEKNIEEVMDNFLEVQKIDDKAALVIVGDGPEMDSLKRYKESLGLRENVIFTGMVPWDSIEDYYGIGDIFVSASTSETQGLTYAEALASSLPLLVRKDPCLNNILLEKLNGVAYENQSQFLEGYKYLINAMKSSEFKNKIRNSIEFLKGEKFAIDVEKVYMDLMQEVRSYCG